MGRRPAPAVGEHVLVPDGMTGPLEGVIDESRRDGALVLFVPAVLCSAV